MTSEKRRPLPAMELLKMSLRTTSRYPMVQLMNPRCGRKQRARSMKRPRACGQQPRLRQHPRERQAEPRSAEERHRRQCPAEVGNAEPAPERREHQEGERRKWQGARPLNGRGGRHQVPCRGPGDTAPGEQPEERADRHGDSPPGGVAEMVRACRPRGRRRCRPPRPRTAQVRPRRGPAAPRAPGRARRATPKAATRSETADRRRAEASGSRRCETPWPPRRRRSPPPRQTQPARRVARRERSKK